MYHYLYRVSNGLQLLTVCLALSLLITGCGQPDTPNTAAQHRQSQPTPILTPTLSSLDATKQADDQHMDSERATAMAGPTSATITFPPTAPLLPPPTGIDDICDSVYADNYDFLNCWRGTYDHQWLTVFAGSHIQGDTQGLVTFYFYDETTGTASTYFKYPTPSATGAVHITHVVLPHFTLVSTTGTTYIFNIETRSWEDIGNTPTATPSSSTTFPLTPLLDSFNRPDGTVGNSWIGNTVGYTITNVALHNQGGNASTLLWHTSFGADQEVFITLPVIDTNATEIDLLLKAQDTSECNLLEVWYQPTRGTARVSTCHNYGTWIQHGSDLPLTLIPGDQFGARAHTDGTVEIYKNGGLVGSVTVGSDWPYRSNPGAIGIWLLDATSTVIDDVGGGTVP